MKYAFIEAHRPVLRVRPMYRILKAHPSGFYAWLKEPLSTKAKDDRRLTSLLKQTRQDVFDYINLLLIIYSHNLKRKHGKCGMLSPIAFEWQQKWKLEGV